MHVGKSDKDYYIGNEDTKRVLAGSKGVGRFALARLGEEVVLTSKMSNCKPITWRTDWNISMIEDMDIEVPQGTKFIIHGLRDNWTPSRVKNLREFLSKTYNDDVMRIIAELLNLSSVTVRRYLNYLSETGKINSKMNYETGGRPCMRYGIA